MPEKASASVSNSVYYLLEMLQILPVIFLMTVVIEAWIPKETIILHMGDKSGCGAISSRWRWAVFPPGRSTPLFPISKTLLGKGASISNIVIILSSWAVIKVPCWPMKPSFSALASWPCDGS